MIRQTLLLLPLAFAASALLMTLPAAASGAREEPPSQDARQREEPAVSPGLNSEPRIPVYPHEPRERLGEELEPGLENPLYESLPSSSPTPEGSDEPDNPVRPMTPVAPSQLLDE